ncbi:sugar kinase [Rhizobium sp. CAU 1783]
MTKRMLSIGECMVELMQAEGDLLRKGFAGDTFNTAYYARLFLPADWSVDYLTAVGTDKISDEMLHFMEGTGVGTSLIRRIEGRSPGLYMIHLDNGERSFSYWRSASAAKALADDADHLRKTLDQSDVIAFSGITLAILAEDAAERLLGELHRARKDGKLIVFDPNIRPRLWSDKKRMLETITAGAKAASLVMPSFDDEATHFGDADPAATIARYQKAGADGVIVKDGEHGITIGLTGEQPLFVAAAKVGRIVDTTSAGDSFNGSFLARYVQDRNARAAAEFAARVAAAVIGHHGALVTKDKLDIA